jgi:hypothetical protein
MRRYLGFDVNHYDFTLRCLAYESLRLVQESGNSQIIQVVHPICCVYMSGQDRKFQIYRQERMSLFY